VPLKASARGYDVKDPKLAAEGQDLIEWAAREMPVLTLIRLRFLKEQPLKGLKIGACLHVTSETANLMLTLKGGGADVALCASNPLSTNDAVAAALATQHNIKTYAIRGEDNDTYYEHIEAALDHRSRWTTALTWSRSFTSRASSSSPRSSAAPKKRPPV